MVEDANRRSSVKRRAILISTPLRWVSASFGLAATGAGGVATFLTDNQAGTTTLLLIGGLGILVGLTGRVPERIGKEGLVHEDVEEEAARRTVSNLVSGDAPPEVGQVVAEEFVRAIAEVVRNSPGVTSEQSGASDSTTAPLIEKSRGFLYEHRVEQLINKAIALRPGAILRTQPAIKTQPGMVSHVADFVIEDGAPTVDSSGRIVPNQIAIVVKAGTLSVGTLRTLKELKDSAPQVKMAYLVVGREPSPMSHKMARQLGLEIIYFPETGFSYEDQNRVIAELRSAIQS